jgi:hypothetical protein
MPGNWLGGSNLAQEQVVVEGKEAKDEVVISIRPQGKQQIFQLCKTTLISRRVAGAFIEGRLQGSCRNTMRRRSFQGSIVIILLGRWQVLSRKMLVIFPKARRRSGALRPEVDDSDTCAQVGPPLVNVARPDPTSRSNTVRYCGILSNEYILNLTSENP